MILHPDTTWQPKKRWMGGARHWKPQVLGGLWQVGGLGPMGFGCDKPGTFVSESPKQIGLMYDLLLLFWGDLTFIFGGLLWMMYNLYIQYAVRAHTHTRAHTYILLKIYMKEKKTLGFLWFFLLCFRCHFSKLWQQPSSGPGQAPMINNPDYKGKWYAPKTLGLLWSVKGAWLKSSLDPHFVDGLTITYSNSKKEKQSKILVNSWQITFFFGGC